MSAINHIGQLKPDAHNRRRHNPRNVGMIATSLGEVGAARSIVIDEHGVILAGNATIEAAAQAGIERMRVIDTDGEEIIAVRRTGLSDAQKRRLAIADNHSAISAVRDVDQLLADLNAGESFDGLFYEGELDRLLSDGSVNDPNAEYVGMPEYQNDDTTSEYQVVVHFEKLADLEAFERLVDQKIPERRAKAFGIWFPKRDLLPAHGLRYTNES